MPRNVTVYNNYSTRAQNGLRNMRSERARVPAYAPLRKRCCKSHNGMGVIIPLFYIPRFSALAAILNSLFFERGSLTQSVPLRQFPPSFGAPYPLSSRELAIVLDIKGGGCLKIANASSAHSAISLTVARPPCEANRLQCVLTMLARAWYCSIYAYVGSYFNGRYVMLAALSYTRWSVRTRLVGAQCTVTLYHVTGGRGR